MKMAFISDIHGNANALDAVLEDIKNRQVEKVYCLGDIAYRGPEPQRSVELIRSLDTFVIKGNADEWVVRGVQAGGSSRRSITYDESGARMDLLPYDTGKHSLST